MDLTLTPENPCLAEARDRWGSIFYPVILAFWTDGKSTELGAHPPNCTCELSDNHPPRTHTLLGNNIVESSSSQTSWFQEPLTLKK